MGDEGLEVGGGGFFFAFEDKLEVGAVGLAEFFEGVQGEEEGADGGFVIAGATGVDAPVILITGVGSGQGDWFGGGGAGCHFARAKDGIKRG